MGLRSDILSQPVSQLPLRKPVIVGPQTSIGEAMDKMQAAKMGCVIAIDEHGKLLGKFTERQIIRATLEGALRLDEPISDHLHGAEDCVKSTDPIKEMIKTAQSRQLRFVIVLDEAGRVTGLTGQQGLMEYVAEHFPRQVKVQRMRAKLHLDEREGA